MLLNDIVSRIFTLEPGELSNPPPIMDTLRESLGTVYVKFPTFENVTVAVVTGKRSWSYVPVGSLVLPRTFVELRTEIMSTVFGDPTIVVQVLLLGLPRPPWWI